MAIVRSIQCMFYVAFHLNYYVYEGNTNVSLNKSWRIFFRHVSLFSFYMFPGFFCIFAYFPVAQVSPPDDAVGSLWSLLHCAVAAALHVATDHPLVPFARRPLPGVAAGVASGADLSHRVHLHHVGHHRRKVHIMINCYYYLLCMDANQKMVSYVQYWPFDRKQNAVLLI